MESFVGDRGEEGMSQKTKQFSMLLFATVMIFITTSIYIIFKRLIGKKVLNNYHQIYAKGMPALLY